MKRLATLLFLPALLLTACTDDDGGSVTTEGSGSSSGSVSASASGSGSASGSAAAGCEVVGGTRQSATAELHLTLDEWTIETDADTVEAGVVTFEAVNEGEDDHEVVIVKGATPDELTITEDGLDESTLPEGAEVLGELERFPGGGSCTGSFELEPGDYSLVCNIVEEAENEAHAHEGMVTALTVS